MWEKITAFFMSILAFIMGIFGITYTPDTDKYLNISYGNTERQCVDLYVPKEHDGDIDLVLFIHGGAWIEGDKSSYTNNAIAVTEEYGLAAATMNYRYLSTKVSMADIVNDINAALSSIKKVGESNGIKIDKVLLTGASAGAHLSLLYAYSKSNVAPITPAAVVSFSGPTDFLDLNFYKDNALGEDNIYSLMSFACGTQVSSALFETPEVATRLQAISPLYHVDSSDVPTVIAHGCADTIVPYSNAVSLDAALTQAGVPHDFITYPNSDHSLSSDAEQAKIVDGLLREYVSTYLSK